MALIFALMGAFFWAIRGTGGYGGTTGGLLAGLGWALLWQYFSHRDGAGALRPYASARAVAAITLGVAFGGMTGYGVYTSWVTGVYQMNQELSRPIAPWTGYAMLFVCGLHWGGMAGVFLAWCAPARPMTWPLWAARIAAGVLGNVIVVYVVTSLPQFFLPFHSEGYYSVAEYSTSRRAEGSLSNVMGHVGLFLGFLVFEIVRRDWRAVRVILTLALGFALPFSIGGYWHTFRSVDLAIDWWKNWEMSIGFGGGLAFALAFLWFNQPDAPRPHVHSRLELLLGAGVPIIFAFGAVVLGAYEGFIRLHQLESSLEETRGTARMIYNAVAWAALVWWAWRMHRAGKTDPVPPGRGPLSPRFIGALLAAIVAAGYLTSVPAAPALANYVLLTLYTGYIIASLALWYGLRRGE